MTYVRGASTVDVPATIGRTKYEVDDGHVVRIEFTDRDFLILAVDLILDGQLAEPQRGDRIREGTREFEVLDWRYSDPYRQTWRMTTKHLGATET